VDTSYAGVHVKKESDLLKKVREVLKKKRGVYKKEGRVL